LDRIRRFSVIAFSFIALGTAFTATHLARGESAGQEEAAAPHDHPGAALHSALGASGKLRALIGTPASLAQNPVLRPWISSVANGGPGVYPLGVTAPDGDSLFIVSLRPLDALRDARLAAYRVGSWPTTGLAAQDPRYAPPPGFIPVTPENQTTPVSKRFLLRDFLTHDQQQVWPKVLVLQAPLIDKLELIGDELKRWGLPDRLHVMSGFRTPQYNAQGVGSKGGRAAVSRHIYGDAADVFVYADGDGVMDDLDGDGKITIGDARVLLALAADIEARHPDLVGGLSAYPANSAHGPFVHIDTRGVRARW
jgi:uncharacterized protein YcbK (DUF882 family)